MSNKMVLQRFIRLFDVNVTICNEAKENNSTKWRGEFNLFLSLFAVWRTSLIGNNRTVFPQITQTFR